MNKSLYRVGTGVLGTSIVLGLSGAPVWAASGGETNSSLATASQIAVASGSGVVNSGSPGLSNSPTVKLTQTDVISMVEKLFPSLAKMYMPVTVQQQADPMDAQRQVYQLSWTPYAGPQQGPNLNQNFANVMVDANTGQVLSFQNQGSSWRLSQPISEIQSQRIAQDWVKKLAANQVSALVLQNITHFSGGDVAYLFIRKIHGIPAPFDRATVMLNPAGHLVNYWFSWHPATFPSLPGTLLSLSAAQAAFGNDLNLQLRYQAQFLHSGPGPEQLVYEPQLPVSTLAPLGQGAPILDAVSGQMLAPDGTPLTASPLGNLQPLVAQGPSQWPTVHSPVLSLAQLEPQVRQDLGLSEADWTLSESGQSPQNGGPFGNYNQLNLNFTQVKTQQQVSVNVDASDGMIVNYNSYAQTSALGNNPSALGSSPSSAATTVHLRQVANQFVEQLFPQLTGAIAPESQPITYGVTNEKYEGYAFLIHGVPVTNAFQVGVNKITGEVMDYQLNVDPSATYPSPTGALSSQQALSAYLQRAPVTLQYMLPAHLPDSNAALGSTPFSIQYGDTAQLVYTRSPRAFGIGTLNALSGHWTIVGPYGVTGGSKVVSVGTSRVDQAVALLEQHGILPGPEVHPLNLTASITRAQFVQWLERAYNENIDSSNPPQFPDVSSSNRYAASISKALMQGWLPGGGNFYPTQTLTRLQAVDWLVRWMGWHDAMTNPQFFKLPYQDVSAVPSADRGAVTVAVDDGLFPLIHGKFNPSGSVSTGQAAMALVQAIRTILAMQN